MRRARALLLALYASCALGSAARADDSAELEVDEAESEASSEAADASEDSDAGDDAEDAEGGTGGYTRDGWYVAVAGVNALDNFSATPFGVKDSFGVNGRLGYRFLEYASLEFEYERVFKFRMRNPPDGTDFQVNVFTANARGYVPFWRLGTWASRLHPYALAGIGLHQVDVDDHGAPFGKFGGGEKGAFAARMGGGLDLYLTDQLVLFQETSYVLPVERDNHEMQYVAVAWGLQWRFQPDER
jgi:hypothetical protein